MKRLKIHLDGIFTSFRRDGRNTDVPSVAITRLLEDDLKGVFLYCDVPTRCKLRRPPETTKNAQQKVEFRPIVPDRPPPEALEEVILYCDVWTRHRLRRVSRYWKHFVSRPDLSETVITSFRCMLVRFTYNQPQPAASCFPCRRKKQPDHDVLSRHDCGYYDAASNSSGAFSLTDHRRCGILGPHVRVLIFDDSEASDQHESGRPAWYNGDERIRRHPTELTRIIRSIAFYCTNLQHIVLSHLNLYGICYLPTLNDFSTPTPPSGMPSVTSVALVNSYYVLGFVDHNVKVLSGEVPTYRFDSVLERKVHCLSVTDHWSDHSVQADRELTDWVAKYAGKLPEHYHKWAMAEITLYEEKSKAYPAVVRQCRSTDLRSITTDSVLDYNFAQILASCIVYQTALDPGLQAEVEPAPASLVTRFTAWDVCRCVLYPPKDSRDCECQGYNGPCGRPMLCR